ncbi:MAG: NMD3-related protein [Candidatus Hodarchaeota archaeon]
MPNRFCAICGKGISDSDPHFGLCYDCYLKEKPLFDLPKLFSLNICIDCGRYSKKEVWIESRDNELFSTIRDAIHRFLLKDYLKKGNIEFSIIFEEKSFIFSSKDLLTKFDVVVIGKLKENPTLKHQETININLNYLLCKNCSNIRGGTYYISIIQLRVKDETQFDLIDKVLKEINKYVENIFEKDQRHYISKIEDQKFGIDLYLSSNELMNYIISLLRVKYYFIIKRTKKLIGRDIQKGKNLYRLKTLIKFLPIQKNDNIIIENEEYLVEKINKKKVFLRNKMNSKLIKDYSYFFNQKIIRKKI